LTPTVVYLAQARWSLCLNPLTHSLTRRPNEIETTFAVFHHSQFVCCQLAPARHVVYSIFLPAKKMDDNELQEESGRNGPKHLGNRQAACSAAELCRKDNDTAVFSTGG